LTASLNNTLKILLNKTPGRRQETMYAGSVTQQMNMNVTAEGTRDVPKSRAL